MGREEKVNSRSWWYRKRHPVIIEPVETIVKKTGLWHRLINFIKNLFLKKE